MVMIPADHAPSDAPLPPELAALDFDPFLVADPGALIELAHREVELRSALARATRLSMEAEAEYLAADSEPVRRAWLERARRAEHDAAGISLELQRVLLDRARVIRDLDALRCCDLPPSSTRP